MARLPLAAAFVLFVDDPVVAVVILFAAGLTDVLDGWYARRFDQVTATGIVVDPITDKLFVLTVVITLVVTAKLSWWAVLLLSTREIGELPLLLWFMSSRRARRSRAERRGANVPGKLATLLQFGTVAATLLAPSYVAVLIGVTAVAGAAAAAVYWVRTLRAVQAVD
jgi:CDP-diacylglycerol--glycerol-3-phosphate 3-phosphatidyltransferase/cardiolipin synthase